MLLSLINIKKISEILISRASIESILHTGKHANIARWYCGRGAQQPHEHESAESGNWAKG
jgi:hypothetical protein